MKIQTRTKQHSTFTELINSLVSTGANGKPFGWQYLPLFFKNNFDNLNQCSRSTLKKDGNNMTQEVVIMAKNKKEAKKIASKNYRQPEYIRPYRYASKGNNFYLFTYVLNPHHS